MFTANHLGYNMDFKKFYNQVWTKGLSSSLKVDEQKPVSGVIESEVKVVVNEKKNTTEDSDYLKVEEDFSGESAEERKALSRVDDGNDGVAGNSATGGQKKRFKITHL